MYQSPLGRSRLRNESVDSNLSKAATPIKTSKEIAPTVESSSKENKSLKCSNTNVKKTNPETQTESKKRGRKRKVTSSPLKIVPKDQVRNEKEPNQSKRLKF